MRWFLPGLVTACLSVAAWQLQPLCEAPPPIRLEVEGARAVVLPESARIEAVLLERAPGWGIQLRAHVARAIAEESARAGFDPLLILALIEVESEFEQQATSVRGARGLMQLRPPTLAWVARREGLRLSVEEIAADPSLNVRLGVRYLKYLNDTFKGRLDHALMAYNAGPRRLFGALRERNTEAWQNYVRAVRREYAVLRRAHGEAGDWALASRDTFLDGSAP